jgi:hypothetical protein
MSNPMMFFVPAIVVVPLVTILSTAQTSLAQPAADECKTEPGSSAPRAAIGTTASTARISGTVGTSDPKVQRCVRKHVKRRRAGHHQRGRRSARMLKRLA